MAPRLLFGHLKQRREGVEAGATAKWGKDAGNARGMGRCLAWRRLSGTADWLLAVSSFSEAIRLVLSALGFHSV